MTPLAGGAVRVEGTTKGGRSRVVSLDAGTVEVMRAHRKAQLAEQLAARTRWQDGDDLNFLREDGAPMHTDTPTALMPKLIAAAGLPHSIGRRPTGAGVAVNVDD